jgi:hypothetical protein
MMTNPTGQVTQGQFSFLPALTDDEIAGLRRSAQSYVANARRFRAGLQKVG